MSKSKEQNVNKKRNILKEMRKHKNAYLFLLPLFTGLIVFCYFPPISGIFRSFYDWNGVGDATFIGFDNYKNLFKDEVFLKSIPTMFQIMIPRLLIGIIAPLVMAEVIFAVANKKIQSFYRVSILLPIVAPGVVGLLIWQNIFDPNTGLLSAFLKALRILPADAVVNWLSDPKLVIPSIIFMGFPWIGGTSVLIYMSGLMNISSEVIEASRLDGASTFYRIRKIDLPLLIGQIRYFLIFGIIGGLQDYGTQIVLTKGGPGYSTYVPGYYMYIQAFTAGKMGYACAIGTTIFISILVLTILSFRFMKKNNEVSFN